MQSEGALADARPSPVSTDGRSSEASSSGLVCEAVEESVPWQSTAANPYSAIRPAEPRSSFSLRLSVVPYLLWIKDACTFQPWEAVNSYELTPKALLLLPVDNFVRRPMIRLVRWKVFEGFMLLAILANCVTLAMDSSAPGFADTDMGLALKRANYVFIGLFTVECVTKVLALGFVFGQYTYLRNGWNILDFLVVIMGFLELSPIGNYTFIRSFRALRPLRSITKIKALKDIVSALIGSLPMLGDVIILALFFFSVFGVFGLEIFKGIYVYRCAWPDFGTSFIETVDGIDYVMNVSYIVNPDNMAQQGAQLCKGQKSSDVVWTNTSGVLFTPPFGQAAAQQLNPWGYACPYQPTINPVAINYPDGQFCTEWGNPDAGGYRNWDNILLSWIQVYQHFAVQDWSFIMYNSQATVSWWMWVLHVTMVIFGGFLIINLTIAVIFINFNKAYSGSSSSIPDSGYDDEGAGKGSAEHGGEARVLAHLDSTWDAGASGRQDDQAVSAGAATGDVPVRPSALRRAWERVRDYCYIIQCSKWFEHTTTGMIIANAIVLALVWYNMPAQLALATMYLNYFFTMYFFVEMLIKLAGLGPVVYVQDPMNCFDGVVTIAGVIEFILSVVPSVTGLGGVMSVFRAFRLLRILRLARHWKSLRRIIAVMFSSLQSVSWLTVLLFLFLFIAGLLGMSFFGYKLSYCEIDGAEQICPPGLTFEECPATLDCYIACDQTLELQWYEVDGSPYGDQAYCEVFPRTPVVGMVPTYWAQVGQAATLTANYDSIGGAIITVFVLLTADNYDVNMKETMVLAGPWLSALFTIGVMIFGIFMILNLFLALLLSNLDQLDEEDMSSTASTMADDDAANGEARERAGADNALEPGAERDRDRIRERPWGTRSFTGGGNGQGHGFADDGQSLYLPKASALRQKTALGGLNQQDGGGVYIWPPADGIGDGGGGGAGSDFGTPRSEDSGSVLIGTKPQSSGGVDSPQEAHGLKPYHHLPAITSAYYGGQVVPLPLALSVPLLPPDANAARRPGGGRGVSFGGMHAGSGDRERVVASSGSESRLAGRTLSHARLVRPLGFGEHPPEQQPEAPQLEGYALFVFSPTNPIRTGLFSLISNKWFEYTMLVLILASSLALCFDDASAKKGTQKAEALYVMDIIFCVSFGVEAVMKMIVYGVAFNGKGSYVRDGWNLLDLFVVVVQVLVLILEAVTKNSNLVWLRAFRAIRALRPVRAAAQIEGIRVVVLAMFLAAPAVAEVMLVATLFYFIFAVLGVELFMGKFFLCSSDGNQLDPYYLLSSGNINKTWCNTDDGQQTITTSYYHSALGVDVPPWTLDTKWGDNGNLNRFDNVIMALWVLIQMATLENWSDVMYQAMQTTGVNEQPLQGANNIVSIYFLIFVIFGSFFILNLVIGVSIDKFNKLKKSQGGKSLLLTGKQQDWLTIQRMMANTKPKPRYPVPANPIRRVCHTIALSNAFDVAMVAVILANIISMFMVHEGQSVEWDNALKIANAVFTGIYIVEMFMKQAAIGFRAYFHDGWCIFDFVVVVVSVTGVICDYATTADLSFILLLRVLRVLRIIKLIPKAKGLKMLMMTLLWSLPALGNVALVLFMFMFIYAIIGMNLFGNIKLQESIIFMANFRDFPTSMLLLFRMTTIENWNALMWDCMQKEDCMLVDATVDVTATDGTVTTWWAGTYLDPVSDADTLDSIPDWAILNECSPAPVLAAFYFVTYMMVVVYLMVQLVIGIILENIETHARIDNMKVKQQHIQDFLETWEDLDPKGSSYIPVATLTSLLQAVGPPVGVKGAGNVSLRVQAIVQDINIPVRASGGVQSIHFMETLHALAGRVAGQNLPAEEEFTIHNRMVARLPKDELPPKYSVADFYAALHVKASIQGFLVRRRLMPMLHEITEGLRPSPAIVAKPDKSGIFAKFAPGEDDEGTGAGNASRRLLQRTTTFITDMFRSKSQVVPEPQVPVTTPLLAPDTQLSTRDPSGAGAGAAEAGASCDPAEVDAAASRDSAHKAACRGQIDTDAESAAASREPARADAEAAATLHVESAAMPSGVAMRKEASLDTRPTVSDSSPPDGATPLFRVDTDAVGADGGPLSLTDHLVAMSSQQGSRPYTVSESQSQQDSTTKTGDMAHAEKQGPPHELHSENSEK